VLHIQNALESCMSLLKVAVESFKSLAPKKTSSACETMASGSMISGSPVPDGESGGVGFVAVDAES